MERKDFLKKGFLAALGISTVAPLMSACKKEDLSTTTNSGTSIGSTSDGSCTDTPTGEEGPFPTHTPSSLVTSNINSDRTGVPLAIRITVNNKNNNCAALSGAIVDVWHCDKDGNYSEYGGSGMQSTNYTSVHFCRGRQVTDNNGAVQFTSIFPGWYSGRATHIHVHVYSATGKSLLITQIAFPADACNAVYTGSSLYTKGLADTSNTQDHVFQANLASMLATVSGSVSEGYTLSHIITVES